MNTVLLKVAFCIIVTIACYFVSLKIYNKYKKNWLNPLYTASVLLISLLLLFHVHEETYQQVNFIFNQLLQLAVVSLAVPLYKQWSFLKKNYKKIFVGVICGTALGVISILSLSHLFHLNEQLLASLIPKSVTLPIALTIAKDLGGLASTTIIFVIISALISVMIGPNLLKYLGIKSKSAKGLAMGTSAQMLGANRSLVWGEEEGAMGNVAMTTSALFLALVVPIIPYLL
ncbi:LrgB family protein [Peribacillus asahii]|uniref:LrgB family protein n=1 Tax=Peribacillus asahii TaxID=228899 RepID=UPI0020794F58|nr:LrgB family protein [Peribacillus asahii]USK58095.1 LrgB family protein [Peribacillus asahii]